MQTLQKGLSAAVAKILIVDEHPTGREILAAMLGRRGHDSTVAADGKQALAILRDTAPDLVVSDIVMADIDGYELVRRMRADPRTASTLVIFCTAGCADEPARALAASLGVSRILSKPSDPQVILESIDAALASNPSMIPAPPHGPEALRQNHRETLTSSIACSADELQHEIAKRMRVDEQVAERTRELTERTLELIMANTRLLAEADERGQIEAALRQSQKMEAVGQLTGGLAHDFNNLLQGILGSLELMRVRAAQGRTAEFGRYIETAMGSANRAAALMHRLLAFSRRQTLDPKPIDVNALVGGIEEWSRRTIGPRIQLQTSLTGEPWPTLCDPHQLEGALMNLVVNARDAMPDGGHLLIETVNTVLRDRRGTLKEWPPQDVPPGEYVALSVADTGAGMTPEVTARAFDPFFTTKPLGEGTGLGLSMVYGFVLQSGGHVRLRSEVGQGTTVAIYLPRHLGPAIAAMDSDAAAHVPTGTSGTVVLVVEDEVDVRMVICDFLADLGYSVLEAESGQAGLAIADAEVRIDLLVTDVGLPGGMNGRQLADAARQRRPALKVLFITGYAESMVAGYGEIVQGMQVMIKPFALDTLAVRVQDMITG